MSAVPRLLITPGEPAGIGPELLAELAADEHAEQLVAIADPELLRERAELTGRNLALLEIDPDAPPEPHRPGTLYVIPEPLVVPAVAGTPDPANAPYVLKCLDRAVDLCLDGRADAMITGPVQKSVINEAGIPFSGHTEYLAKRCGTDTVVMMLAGAGLRVALATTHIPLSDVPTQLSPKKLTTILTILMADLRTKFGREQPRVAVLGLNPHAGEAGHIGREEVDWIIPCLEQLQERGMQLEGPLPADTAFSQKRIAEADAFLAMYHDQGLPVLKYAAFGKAVNITLGLPIIRCSVDHGTALDLAGTGSADTGSLRTAVEQAAAMVRGRVPI